MCRLFKNFLIFVEANKKMEKGVDGLNDYEGSGLIASDGENLDGGNTTKLISEVLHVRTVWKSRDDFFHIVLATLLVLLGIICLIILVVLFFSVFR